MGFLDLKLCSRLGMKHARVWVARIGREITSFCLSTPEDGVYRGIISRAYDYSVL